MNWEWASRYPGAGSSNGIQRLRAEEDEDITEFSSITAVDPGGSTGISTVWYCLDMLSDPELSIQKVLMGWESACLRGSENEQTLNALRWLADRSFSDAGSDIVIEDFILQSSLKSRDLLSPVRIGHKIDYQLWRGIRIASGDRATFEPYWQSANDAKNVMNDERLRTMAMYTPGPDHARDATRHALLWLRKHRADLARGNS